MPNVSQEALHQFRTRVARGTAVLAAERSGIYPNLLAAIVNSVDATPGLEQWRWARVRFGSVFRFDRFSI